MAVDLTALLFYQRFIAHRQPRPDQVADLVDHVLAAIRLIDQDRAADSTDRPPVTPSTAMRQKRERAPA